MLTMTSVTSSRKRRLIQSGDLDVSSKAVVERKRKKSCGNELEGTSPTFSAKCFYCPTGQGSYQTPLDRQKQREQLGIVLPPRPAQETVKKIGKTRKITKYRSLGHMHKGAHPSWTKGAKTTTSPMKSKAGEREKISQTERLEETTNLSKVPQYKTTPKKLKKTTSIKRTPRKSPKNGVKKAVKLYIQGMKKDPKAANKCKKDSAKSVIVMKQSLRQDKVSKEMNLNQECCTEVPKEVSDKSGYTSNNVTFSVQTPKASRKRRMKIKEDCGMSMSPEKDKQSLRKYDTHSPNTCQGDSEKMTDVATDNMNFLDGIQVQTSDSVKTCFSPKASPKKLTVITPSFMTPPISPSTRNITNTTGGSPAMNKICPTSAQVQQRKLIIMKKMVDNDNMEQMSLDLGQKRFGATSCEICGMVYTAAHPEDEASHDKFHRKYLGSIKFPGWKKERLLQEFDDGRVIMVLHDDPKYHTRKVEEIRQLVDQELGFLQGDNIACKMSSKVLLFITTDKKVAGCLIAEEISQGYRVIADEPSAQSADYDQQRAWCCETNPEPAVCGVSRIWVASQERRKQIATKLLDCLRNFFMFGSVLPKESIAFSDPTTDGKMLATAYMNTARFLVYKYH